MKLLAIDGNSIMNRAFYGIKLLTTKGGIYTNGIYGFLSILLRVLEETAPDRVAVAFDKKGPTFRHQQFDGYKAGRKGMPPELLARVTSPFATTRTTRKVGLGIPMMMENAEKAGGSLKIESQVGKGTVMTVTMDRKNIDCLPLGDLGGTLLSLILAHPTRPDFLFEGKSPRGECSFDTRAVRGALGNDIPLNEPEVAEWLRQAIGEEIDPIFGGG